MKKSLLFATLASAALASCVNDDKMDMAQQAKKISFDAPVMATQTRTEVKGEITTSTYPDKEKFVVYAKQTEGDLKAWASGTNFWETDLEAITVQKEGTTAGWEHETTDYYWPKSTSDDQFKLSFNAYSPAEFGTGTPSCGNDGLTITDFTVNQTVAEQVDLMYSGPILNCTEEQDGTDGVKVKFKHALSSIVFAAVEDDAHASYKIDNIEMTGAFHDKGTFKENLTMSADTKYEYSNDEAGKAEWTSSASYTNSTITYSPAVKNADVTTATTDDPYKEVTNGTSAILTIPQNIPNEAVVKITYTVTPGTNVGGVATQYTKTIRLSDFKKETESITKWEKGNRYIYLIKFEGTKKIFFVPEHEGWKNTTLEFTI